MKEQCSDDGLTLLEHSIWHAPHFYNFRPENWKKPNSLCSCTLQLFFPIGTWVADWFCFMKTFKKQVFFFSFSFKIYLLYILIFWAIQISILIWLIVTKSLFLTIAVIVVEFCYILFESIKHLIHIRFLMEVQFLFSS